MADQEVVVQALGRPSFLGQLYSASETTLLNISLFSSEAIDSATVAIPSPRTETSFKEVRSTKDRADLLDVSANVSVSLLGGTVKLKGFGKYLDRSDLSEVSNTVAGMVRVRTVHRRIDLSDELLQRSIVLDASQIQSQAATHVVTGITYGGTLLGSLTEISSKKSDFKNLSGGFSLSSFQKLAAFAGAEGSVKLSEEEKKALNTYSLEINLIADYVDNDPTPTTKEDIIKAIEKGLPGFTSDTTPGAQIGVPVDLILTPISRFEKLSIQLVARELAEADLLRIQSLYDDIVTLFQQRNTLLLQLGGKVEGGESANTYGTLFPSFFNTCRDRLEAVESLLVAARSELGVFLRDYRTLADPSLTAGTFLDHNVRIYNSQHLDYQNDFLEWQVLLQQARVASKHGFPLCSTAEIAAAINKGEEYIIVMAVILLASVKSICSTPIELEWTMSKASSCVTTTSILQSH